MKISVILLVALVAVLAQFTLAEGEPKGQSDSNWITPSNATEQWLDSVVIPEVDFRAANLFDCISFIQSHMDKYAVNKKQAAPRFAYDAASIQYLLHGRPDTPHRHPPLPTFRAVDISAFRVMIIIGKVCEVQFETTEGWIVVKRKQETANKPNGE